jgi:hypothetical protein
MSVISLNGLYPIVTPPPFNAASMGLLSPSLEAMQVRGMHAHTLHACASTDMLTWAGVSCGCALA